MRLLGHPIHLMLVHFPAALFPMECVLYSLLLYTGEMNYAYSAFYALVGGVSIGWVAAFFGALDMATISSEKVHIIKKALLHGCTNGVVLIAYTVMIYGLWNSYPKLPYGSLILLCVKLFLVSLLILGNFIGGSLVLKDKVGIEKT